METEEVACAADESSETDPIDPNKISGGEEILVAETPEAETPVAVDQRSVAETPEAETPEEEEDPRSVAETPVI